jgi:hypothetical protein
LWLDRLFAHLNANPSKLNYVKEVLHGDLQIFNYDLGDMHTLTPKINEDIEFQIGINTKLNPEIFLSLKNELISSVWTLETITC